VSARTREDETSPKAGAGDWFENWFGEDYLSVYPHRDSREADRAVEFLYAALSGKKIERVLDLACGAGRHSRALGRHWQTTGLDLSETLLLVARREASDASFVRGDMRVLPFRPGAFSLVVNLFTSFGYFSEDGDHRAVLAEIASVLPAGGIFVLDYLNAEQVVANLKPRDERRVNDLVVEQERSITADGRFVEKKITLRGKNKSFVERVRLFSRSQLESLLDDAGFAVEKVFGDYGGEAWTPASSRTMLLGVKR
jgi:SAM-dependent methyltransferase